MAVLAFVLVACGGDDSATDAGAGGDGGAEDVSTSVTDESGDEHADDDHDDDEGHEEDAHDDEDHDDDHDDEEHEEDAHDDEDHDEHEEDHDDDHDESSGGLGAHEHGVAEMSVAWSDGDVVVDLISPTQNIFGFEYEATTEEERALVADRTQALSEPDVIVFNEEAGCDLADDVATELEYEGSHAELTTSWLFSCEQADEISQLDVTTLFTEFPGIEDLDVQWVSPSGQSAAELSPSATVLDLG